jgi:hypothetical protein
LVVSFNVTVPITRSRVPSLVTVIVLVESSDAVLISLLPKLMVPDGDMLMCATGAATEVALRPTVELVWLWPFDVMVTVSLKDSGGEEEDEVNRAVMVAWLPAEMTVLSAIVVCRVKALPETDTLVMVRSALPELVTVMSRSLCWPITTLLKLIDVGETVILLARPVPVSATLVVPSGSFDGMLKVAVLDPKDVGEKTTSSEQVPPGVIVAPSQVSFDLANSDKFVPVMEIVEMTRLTLPLLFMVKVCAEEELPTLTSPKALLVGLMSRFCDATLPLRATLRVAVSGSSDGMPSVALFEPADAGVKVTWIVQVPPDAAMVWPLQVSVPLTNSDELVPDIVTVVMARVAVPEFITVKVCAEVRPTLTAP